MHWLRTTKRTCNAWVTVSLLLPRPFLLLINIKKTEVLCQTAPSTTQPEPAIKIDEAALKNVEDLTYSCLSSSGGLDTEISCRLSNSSSAFGRLFTRIWRELGITQATKLAVYKAVGLPTLLYVYETWTDYHTQHTSRNWTCFTSVGSWEFPGRTESPTRRYFAIPTCQVLRSRSRRPCSDRRPRDENGGQPSSRIDLPLWTGWRHSQAGEGGGGGRQSATNTLSGTLCTPVTPLLKAGNNLQRIAALGGWQPTTEPKSSRKGDCHRQTRNAKPGKRGRPAQLLP